MLLFIYLKRKSTHKPITVRVTEFGVRVTTPVSYGYDGLLTSAGALSLQRYPENSLLKSTTQGNTATDQHFTGFGELDDATRLKRLKETPTYKTLTFS